MSSFADFRHFEKILKFVRLNEYQGLYTDKHPPKSLIWADMRTTVRLCSSSGDIVGRRPFIMPSKG